MRRNHNSQSTFKKVAAFVMGLASLGMSAPNAHANVSDNTTQGQSKKDVVKQEDKQVKPESLKRINGYSEENPYKFNRTPKKNQRQKRKFLRQNPHVRAKYK
jgi:hypothetical protein